jgi:ribosomal protein S27AE
MSDDLGGTFPRQFGVDDRPRCPNCSELTFLSRRSPAGRHALEYERQRFTCPACGLELERVVDAEGFGVELEDS